MTSSTRSFFLLGLIALTSLAMACGSEIDEPTVQPESDDDYLPLLNDLSVIKPDDGYNKADLPAFAPKGDVVLPRSFDLKDVMGKTLNQGRRGTCSIFATTGLMEHLYVKEGTYPNIDFSEQYLQWSAKVQVGGHPTSGGSSAKVNLDAITRFGIVLEEDLPYNPNAWGEAEGCGDIDSLPNAEKTRCYTQGDPSDEVMAKKKWKLDRSSYQSSRTESIKSFMYQSGTGVLAGGDFFYQTWSHGGSNLGINADHKKKGIVNYPSDADKAHSLENPAGHAFMLLGWDDDYSAARLDEDGEPMVDDNGDIIYEQGFFIFRNSWGDKGTWGSENPYGKGYGFVSYQFIEEYARIRSAELKDIQPPAVEVCGDMIDNDDNGDTDCDDSACVDAPLCQPDPTTFTETYTNSDLQSIPDEDDNGVNSSIVVDQQGVVSSLSLSVNVQHSWIGDVEIVLESPTGDIAIIKEKNFQEGTEFNQTIDVTNFAGATASGTWTLYVSDAYAGDTGTLNSWGLNITSAIAP